MILIPPQTANSAIDRAIAIIEKQRIGSFVATFNSLQGKVTRKGIYEVAYIRPDQLKIRARLADSDRTYWLSGESLFAVDHSEKEWLQTTSPKVGNAIQRMAAVVPVDEPVRMLVDPGVGKNFLMTFREIRVWNKSGNLWTAKDGRGKFTLSFDSAGRFSSFRADSPAGWISWKYAYPTPISKAVYPDTKGFRKVDSFIDASTAVAGLPRYTDAASKKVTERSIREYNRLSMVAYSVSDERGTIDVWLNGRDVRQKSAGGEWAWIGGKLTLKQGGSIAIAAKKMSFREVDEAVGRYGCPLDPFLSKLARKQNPVLTLMGPDLKGRFVGGLGFGGVMCDVVEFKGPGVKMTLTVRRDNGLLHAVSTENMDTKGRVIARSERRYTYLSWGKPVRIITPM